MSSEHPTLHKLVVLKLDGDWVHQGFRVMLEIGFEGQRAQIEQMGTLPPAPQILSLLEQWRTHYSALGTLTRTIRPQAIVYDGTLNQKVKECQQWSDQLAEAFIQWLDADAFKPLELLLREEISRGEQVRVLVRSQNRVVPQLPWHLWPFIDRYPSAEVVFGALATQAPPARGGDYPSAVRILAILGHCSGIDIDVDRQLLESIPQTALTLLVEPKRSELNAYLWQQPWDILFFAGHSTTRQDTGCLYLNPTDSLSFGELKYALQQAVRQGLQLAILNSCDGLGLAQDLAQVNLPQMIVMREPVPDFVAQEFLKAFLTAFAANQSLHLAERQAREQLQGLEQDFPCASWLPVVIQNPAVDSLTWQQLLQSESTAIAIPENPPAAQLALSPPSSRQWYWSTLRRVVLVAFLVTSLVLGVRSQGFLQASELRAYDRLVQLRPLSPADDRILLITVDEEDIAYQDEHNMVRKEGWSLSDPALYQVLARLAPYTPRVIGLDIYHPYPFEPNLANLIVANPSFVGICEMDSVDGTPETMTPPPGLSTSQVGFSDLVTDADAVIRRQFISMPAGDFCQTGQAFSLQIAEAYLKDEGIAPIQRLDNGEQQLGKLSLPRLQYNSGGYQLSPAEANGYQILLNYRYAAPRHLSLRAVLADSPAPELTALNEQSVVLIGVDQTWQDQHLTPLQPRLPASTPGVELHAHMVSQLLDAALNGQDILWWLTEWQESIWIFSWAILAGLWAMAVRSPLRLGLGVVSILGGLFMVCWLLLLANGWVPLVPVAFGILGTAVVIAMTARDRPRTGA